MAKEHASVKIDGPKLRQLRKEAGLSCQALGRRVGVSFSYISQLELGRHTTVAPDRYPMLLDALGLEDYDSLLADQTDTRLSAVAA